MKIRQILAILFGCIIIYNVSQTKYQTSMFGDIFWSLLLFLGFILLLVSIIKDSKQYRKERKVSSFVTTFILSGSALLAITIESIVNYDFHKPTLIEAYYDGDYNGVEIDLKTDGTYVQDDSCIGDSDYTYGEYSINGDTIVLRKTSVNKLVFRKIDSELYLIEIDSAGNERTEFRVIEDNR